MNVTDVFISLSIQQRPAGPPFVTWGLEPPGGGRGGWPGSSRAVPGILEGSVFYFSLFSGIMALDINDSWKQLAVINVDRAAGARESPGGGG